MIRIFLAAVLASAAFGAQAQGVQNPPVTWSGTFVVPAAASTALVAGANVTMAPNSAALPTSFGPMTLVNTGANNVSICYHGGTCTIASASIMLAPGAGDDPNLGGGIAPTFYSTGGTTVNFRQGN